MFYSTVFFQYNTDGVSRTIPPIDSSKPRGITNYRLTSVITLHNSEKHYRADVFVEGERRWYLFDDGNRPKRVIYLSFFH